MLSGHCYAGRALALAPPVPRCRCAASIKPVETLIDLTRRVCPLELAEGIG